MNKLQFFCLGWFLGAFFVWAHFKFHGLIRSRAERYTLHLDKTKPWKRFVCWIAGHQLAPTGRKCELIREQLCCRCGNRYIERIDFPGIIVPLDAVADGTFNADFGSQPMRHFQL